MQVLVSIMIPAYNQPQYIERAVQSALAQDYDNVEVIVSDDSTNQQTYDVLKKYFPDKRLIYHKTVERLGRVANYRKLLYEIAKGDWVVMLDGDDYYIDNNYISKAIGIIKQNPSVLLVGAGIQVLDENAGHTRENKLVEADIVFDGKDVIRKKLSLPNHQTDIYLRAAALELNFYRSPSTGSDSESLFRLCLRGQVAYLSCIAAVWRVHKQNATFNHDINSQIRELNFIDSVYKDALAFLDRKTAKEWYVYMYRGMTIHLLSMAFKANNYSSIIKILFYFGKFLGPRQTLVYLLRLLRQYQRGLIGKKVVTTIS